MVFQDPLSSLNPVVPIGTQVTEVLLEHRDMSQEARRRGGGRAARPGRHPRPAAPAERVPAPAVRRDAAARADRDGAGLLAAAAHRRRADHRARRHHPGADPRAAARARRRLRDRAGDDHPRPRRRRRALRPRERHVRRARSSRRPTGTTSSPVRGSPTPAACWPRCRGWTRPRRRRCTPIRGSARDTIPWEQGCAFAPRCDNAQDDCLTEVSGSIVPLEYDGPAASCGAATRCSTRRRRRAPPQLGGRPMTAVGTDADALLRRRGPARSTSRSSAASSSTRPSATSAPSTASTWPSRAGRTYGLVGESGCGKSTLGPGDAAAGRADRGTGAVRRHRRRRRSRASRCGTCAGACRWSSRTRWAASTRGRASSRCSSEPLRAHGLGGGTRGIAEKVRGLLDAGRPAGGGAAPLPARVLRRPAAAHRHRPRDRAGAGPAHRRRAGVRAGRLRPGPGAQPAGGAAGAARTDLPGHRPRPRRRPAHQRRRRRHVPRRRWSSRRPPTTCTSEPLHPYTRALMAAVPVPDPVVEERRERILLAGDLPSPANPPSGCRFHTRCPWRQETRCDDEVPVLRELAPGHLVSLPLGRGDPRRPAAPEVGGGGRGHSGRRRPAATGAEGDRDRRAGPGRRPADRAHLRSCGSRRAAGRRRVHPVAVRVGVCAGRVVGWCG